MGINLVTANFLRSEARRGVKFGRMLTLGHQSNFLDPASFRRFAAEVGIAPEPAPYADTLFAGWGATSVDIIDASDYEDANVVHDLNEPIDPALAASYDTVFDGGALEHIFNLPVALKNCMELVKPGGQLLCAAPMNNFCGHGFFQFSPELFYRALSAANGFAVERAVFWQDGQWYAVREPQEVRSRVELVNRHATTLFISAKRLERKPIFQAWPQQSDYVEAWQSKAPPAAAVSRRREGIRQGILKVAPFLKRWKTRWLTYRQERQYSPANAAWYQPIDLDGPSPARPPQTGV